ncbi:MAG: ABC transporter substrate-binding protein [Deltaproteobacteria bacterium]|nr:ABC transporter substrate-binding protein [Deltaproteobacteria bacterium]
MPGEAAEADEIRVADDAGRELVLERPAQRIIALYGAYNEILAAMGLEDRLVGRTKADRLPPSILSRPSIGTHMRPNVELVLSLEPDLILQSSGRREAAAVVQQLRRHGRTVAVFQPHGFSELFTVIEKMGRLTGEPDAASGLNRRLLRRLDAVERRLRGIEHRPRVFFEVRYPNLLGAGRDSIVNDIIERSGGTNCLNQSKKLVRIGMESLIQSDPEVYVIQEGPMNRAPSPPAERPHFGVLRGVREDRVLKVDEQIFSRPGPRSVDAVETLAAFLHPERF